MSARAPLIGRARELATLVGCLADAAGGLGRVVLVRGEAGIGKTRLAEELSERAVGARPAWGRCWEDGGAPTGWPFVEILRTLGLDRPVAGDFATLDAVTTALVDAARESPLLLVIDDLQWADVASLHLLKLLARRIVRAPILCLGTVRDEDAGTGETLRLLADIAREGVVVRLVGLAEDEAAALVARAGAPEEIAGRIHRAAGGNPFFVEEIAHLCVGVRAGDLPVPDGIRAVVARRLAQLDDGGRALVDRAAAIGTDVELALLRDATVRTGAAWSDAALADAIGRGVLVAAGDRIRFTHDIVRATVLAGAAPVEQRAIAAALESRGADPAVVARHLLAIGDPRGIELAREGGRRAMDRLAFVDAAASFERALEATIAAGGGETTEAAALRLAIGEARIRAGDLARGRAACRAATEQARRLGDPSLLVAAALAYGAATRFAAVDPDHVELLERALAAIAPDDVRSRAVLGARLAAAQQPSETPEVALALARRSIAEARGLDDRALLARVLDAARPAFRAFEDVVERRAMDEETAQLAIELGDEALGQRAALRLVIDLLQQGELGAARARLEGVARAATERRDLLVLIQVEMARAAIALLTGGFDDAEAHLHAVAAHHANLPDPEAASGFNPFPVLRFLLLRARGRIGDAAELAALELRYPPAVRDLLVAAIAIENGDRDGARAAVQRVFDRRDHLHANYIAASLLPAVLAELGDADHAAALEPLIAAVVDTFVVTPNVPFCEGSAARLAGLVALARGRHGDAIAWFARAIARDGAIGAAPFVHASRLAAAEAHLDRDRDGDRDAARELLLAAIAGFDALGMTARAARARRRLETLAVTAPPPPTTALAALRLEGEVWALRHAGTTVRLRDAHGLRYLAHLIDRPGVEVHVAELSALVRGDAPDPGDAGPLLDAEAIAAYRRRVADLRERADEAALFGDAGRAERARTELDFLAGELARAVGLGGRARRAASATERLRVTVTLRIRKAIKKIAALCPPVADHLDRAVSTGTFCRYDPTPGPRVTS